MAAQCECFPYHNHVASIYCRIVRKARWWKGRQQPLRKGIRAMQGWRIEHCDYRWQLLVSMVVGGSCLFLQRDTIQCRKKLRHKRREVGNKEIRGLWDNKCLLFQFSSEEKTWKWPHSTLFGIDLLFTSQAEWVQQIFLRNRYAEVVLANLCFHEFAGTDTHFNRLWMVRSCSRHSQRQATWLCDLFQVEDRFALRAFSSKIGVCFFGRPQRFASIHKHVQFEADSCWLKEVVMSH